MCTNRTATMLHESIDPADTGIIEYAICVFFSPLKIHTWRKNLSNIHIPWRGKKLAFLRGQFKFRKFRRNDISTQHCWHEQMNHGVRVNSRGFSKHFKLVYSVISRYFENTEWRFENRDILSTQRLEPLQCFTMFSQCIYYICSSRRKTMHFHFSNIRIFIRAYIKTR